MVLFRPVAVMLLLFAMMPAVWGISYDVLVQESGNSIVIAAIEGAGLHKLELPADAEPQVKGALYLIKDDILSISIGSTERAIVAYQTQEYTIKDDSWRLNLDLDGPVKIAFPNTTEIISTAPDASVEESDVKTIEYKNASEIEVIYDVKSSGSTLLFIKQTAIYLLGAAIFLVLILSLFLVYKKSKKNK